MTTAGRTSSREQHVVRVLFLLDRAGEVPEAGAPAGAHRLMRGQMRLQAMDFWLRYPDYLADELLNVHERDPAQGWARTAASTIMGSREPEIRRLPMFKWRHGAFERLDDTLAVLTSRHLVVHAPVAGNSKVQEHFYWLMQEGHAVADELLALDSIFAWYADRADLIGRLAGASGGTVLKDRQYEHPEYAATRSNQLIPPIAERVRTRLAASTLS